MRNPIRWEVFLLNEQDKNLPDWGWGNISKYSLRHQHFLNPEIRLLHWNTKLVLLIAEFSYTVWMFFFFYSIDHSIL